MCEEFTNCTGWKCQRIECIALRLGGQSLNEMCSAVSYILKGLDTWDLLPVVAEADLFKWLLDWHIDHVKC